MSGRRLLCRSAALATLGLATLPAFVWTASPAAATAPDAAAWWYKASQGGVPAPAPPNVPKGGLYVAQDPAGAVPGPVPVPAQTAGPAAFATLRATVADGAPATLVLKVAPGSLAQTAAIDACPVSQPGSWQATTDGGPGPMDKAPTYQCGSAVAGALSAAGDTFTWQLPATMQSPGGIYDVALVPHSDPSKPTPPFQVAFGAPDASTVAAAAASAPPAPAPAPDASPAPAPSPSPGPVVSLDLSSPAGGSSFASSGPAFTPGPALTPSAASAPAPAAAGSPAPAATTPPAVVAPPLAVSTASLLNDHRGQRIMAVTVLLLMAVAWWWVGGQADRGPRRLGRIGVGIPLDSSLAGAGARLGGVGRFARPRTGKPKRL